MRTCVFFCLFLLLAIPALYGQQHLSGVVTNEKGEALPFASVRFKADSVSPALYFVIADKSGTFTLAIRPGIREGWVEASAVGYTTGLYPVRLGDTAGAISCVLHQPDKPLPSLMIKADPSVKVSGDTTSFAVDAFKKGNENSLGALLANMPGFRVAADGKISFNGRNIDNILIEQDDLTGSDYGTITKSLSPTGIEKIQVIRNYKDAQNITSAITPSNKQVLNIKFKKQFQDRVFGNVGAKAGGPEAKYEWDGQAISLIHSIKLVALEQGNNIGNTQAAVEQNAVPAMAAPEEQELMDQQPDRRKTIAAIGDINGSLADREGLTSNTTQTSSISLLSRPFKNVILKGLFKFTRDEFAKATTTEQQLYLPPQTFSIFETRKAQFNNILWNNTASLNIMLTPRDQLILAFRTEKANVKNTGSGIFQGENYQEDQCSGDRRLTGKITYNHLLANQSAFIFNGIYSWDRLPGTYGATPPMSDSFLFPPGGYRTLRQQELQQLRSGTVNAKWIKAWRTHDLSFSLKGSFDNDHLANSIAATGRVKDSTVILPRDSSNDVLTRHQEVVMKMEDSWKINKRVTLSGKLAASRLYYELRSFTGAAKRAVTAYPVFGGLTTDVKLSHIDDISVAVNTQPVVPKTAEVAPGFILNGLTQISRGSDTISTGMGYTGELIFSHLDLIRRKFLFVGGITVQRMPYLDIADVFPTLQYTYSPYVYTNKPATTLVFFFNADKYLGSLRNKLSPYGNITVTRQFSFIGGDGYSSNLLQYKGGVSATQDGRLLQVKEDINYSVTRQGYGQQGAQAAITRQLHSQLDLNYRIMPLVYLTLQTRWDIVYPPGQKSANLLLTDGDISYHTRNGKWVFGIKGKNLLDQKTFAQSLISPTQRSLTQYALFPRVTLASVQFKF